jgi:hypothetical protein
MPLPFVSRGRYDDAIREAERLRTKEAESTGRIIGLMADNQVKDRRIAELVAQLDSVLAQVPQASEEPKPAPRLTVAKIRSEWQKAKQGK